MRLKNKIAMITGAASGQGKAEAELFAKEGATLIITDINYNELQNTEEKIRSFGVNVIAFHHDVSSEKDWIKIIEHIKGSFGSLDILINNAGILLRKGVFNTTLNEFTSIQSVNTNGTFLGIKYAAELMKKSGGGSI